MKRILISFLAGLLCVAASTHRADSPQQRYIDQYAELAVREMLRSGVPASITLAQGLLESGAGLSSLAVNGNNHFGIKCHKGWKGRSMRLDDDRPNECFRVYDQAEDSFRDHSDFLRYRDRYKFLFDLERTDYKGWAYGLKRAGYATDARYAEKLIKYIEDYGLSRYDLLTREEEALLPEAPHKIEEPATLVVRGEGGVQTPVSEEFQFPLSRTLYSLNGVPFVYSMEGETYRSIAKYYHLFRWEILRYNDLKKDQVLLPGTIVYLEAKKKRAPEGMDMYIVEEDGEDFHAICQRFAVKEKAIRRLNGYRYGTVELKEGDEVKLR